MLTYKYIYIYLSTYTIIILTSERPSANFQKSFQNNHPRTRIPISQIPTRKT